MTTTQHTPAPWNYDGEFIVNSDGYPIAHVLQGVQSMPKEANARLIGAAPDLLDALEELVGRDETEARESGFDDDEMSWLEDARRAIAKAKGGAS